MLAIPCHKTEKLLMHMIVVLQYCFCMFLLQYIKKTVKTNQKPELILTHKSELKVDDRFQDPMFNVLAQKEEEAPPLPSKQGRFVSWDIEDKVQVTFHLAKNVNVIEKSGVSTASFFVYFLHLQRIPEALCFWVVCPYTLDLVKGIV